MLSRFLAERVLGVEAPGKGPVLNKLKQLVRDSIGCLVAGTRMDEGQRMMHVSSISSTSNAPCTIPGLTLKTNTEHAVFVNSYLANLLDFDDTYHGHPGAVIIPVSLAVSEMVNATGRQLLNAVLAGYEAAGFIARGTRPTGERFKFIRGSNTHLIFGASAAASKLLGLGLEETIQALAIAAVSAPVPSTRKFGFNTGLIPTVKNHYGWSSLGGFLSAVLAGKGFRADPEIFDGEVGFTMMIGSDRDNFSQEISALQSNPSHFTVEKVSFKPYSCCRYLHAPLDSLQDALSDIPDRSSIEKIEFLVNYEVDNDFGRVHPVDAIGCQFSLPHTAAMIVMGIEPGIQWFEADGSWNHEESRMWREKVSLYEWDLASQAFRDNGAHVAKAEVTLRGGKKVIGKTVDLAKGDPGNAMSEEDLIRKFTSLCHPVLGNNVKALLSAIGDLENIREVADLTKLLRP